MLVLAIGCQVIDNDLLVLATGLCLAAAFIVNAGACHQQRCAGARHRLASVHHSNKVVFSH